MTPQTVVPGWSPLDPPADRSALTAHLAEVTYAVSCGDVSSTAWSAAVADDTATGIAALLVTTSAVTGACADLPGALVTRQGDATIDAQAWVHDPTTGLGSVIAAQHLPYVDWTYVPMPRMGQWVGVAARSADGTALPLLELRITGVGTDTFTVDAPIRADYRGGPVVDNRGRALGVVTSAGAVVTGAPQFCDTLFDCTDTPRVWWDIAAPSAVRSAKAVPGKGSVTVTWQAAASDGGDDVAYWYRVGIGPWKASDTFRVKVKARKGQLVAVSIGTVNHAGPGPTVTVSAKAK